MTVTSSKMLQKINDNPISKDEMRFYLYALNCNHQLPPFSHCVEVAMSVFNDDTAKCYSLNVRLEALNRILSSGELHGWINDGDEEGCFYIPENVFIAAGITPLIAEGLQLSFNKDDLLQNMFKIGRRAN